MNVFLSTILVCIAQYFLITARPLPWRSDGLPLIYDYGVHVNVIMVNDVISTLYIISQFHSHAQYVHN